MPGPPRSVAAAVLAAAAAAGCGSDTTKAPSIAGGSSVVAPTTVATDGSVPPTSGTALPPSTGRPAATPVVPPDEQCLVRVTSWAPDREALTVHYRTGVTAAVVLARATDAGSATSSTSMTDTHGEGHAQLRVAREPVGRLVRVDISAAGGAKACSTTFEVAKDPFETMHGGMP